MYSIDFLNFYFISIFNIFKNIYIYITVLYISGFVNQVPNATEFSQCLINCNVVSVTRMCIIVLPQMVERKKGLILNISSASAVLPTPLMTMYSSTKVKSIWKMTSNFFTRSLSKLLFLYKIYVWLSEHVALVGKDVT